MIPASVIAPINFHLQTSELPVLGVVALEGGDGEHVLGEVGQVGADAGDGGADGSVVGGVGAAAAAAAAAGEREDLGGGGVDGGEVGGDVLAVEVERVEAPVAGGRRVAELGQGLRLRLRL